MTTEIEAVPNTQFKWVTAIMKVSPKSGPFWYDYGQRYNEKITIEFSKDKDPQGRRCVNVLVFTKRTVGDVVLSAWQEYNRYLVQKGNQK